MLNLIIDIKTNVKLIQLNASFVLCDGLRLARGILIKTLSKMPVTLSITYFKAELIIFFVQIIKYVVQFKCRRNRLIQRYQ